MSTTDLLVGVLATQCPSWAVRVVTASWELAVAVARPIGRRGAATGVFAVSYALYGVLLFREQSAANIAAFGVATQILPVGAWGVVFMLVGVAALMVIRCPGKPRDVVFGVFCALAGSWGMSGLLAPDTTGAEAPWAWVAGLLWMAVLALLLITAGVGDRASPP
jgi:hypothetical protein